jgi:transcriptional regulator with XRE-family HTH domain
MTDVHTLLARNMKKYRKILGISQEELAERMSCSLTLIGNIEIKKRFPSSKNLSLLAHVLGVRPADLFAEGNDAQTVPRIASWQNQKAQLENEILKAIDRVFRANT